MHLFIEGEPSTFATTSEKIWKQRLALCVPLLQEKKRYKGIALRFTLSTPFRHNQPFDLDNLVEPVLSVLISKKGYFSGKRTNLEWWYARKDIGNPAGVEIEIFEGKPSIDIKGKEIFNGEYSGELPKSATSKGLPQWLISFGFRERRCERFGIHLIFPERVNIGEISTGTVKSTIDCLWPIIGGKGGAPEDWRIDELLVERQLGYNSLRLKVFGR